MTESSLLLLSIAPVVALASCAPPDIPSSASTHWSLKEGFYWTWYSPVREGCISWMAMEHWVSVQVLVDRRCNNGREKGFFDGKGLTYFSPEDHLTFKGYWPWTSDIYDKLIIFNKDGNVKTVLPCPHVISAKQVSAMQIVVNDAMMGDNTDSEKRVLSRISARLASVSSVELSSSQAGCTDEPKSSEGRKTQTDPWTAN